MDAVAQDAGFVCSAWVAPDAGVADAGSGSAGCGQPASVGTTDRTISVAGVTRQYRQSIPLAAYDPQHRHRLIIGLGGCGWQGSSLQNAFLPEAYGGDAIWLYPTGLQDNACGPPPNSFGWDPTPGSADVQFFDAVLASAMERLCIDPDRVHVWGRSRGGFLAHTIAATRTSQLASAAVLSSAMTVTPTIALPIMVYHAQNDSQVPYSLGLAATSAWASADGCAMTPATPTTPSACSTLACQPREVEWCNPATGNHWPLSWAGPEALEFLLAHPRVH
jgi:poly(3-hydroxybutyrate) depolymerase